MKQSSRILLGALLCILAAGCSSSDQAPACFDPELDAGDAPVLDAGGAGGMRVLLYTYSTGYRHASIPDGINAIRAMGLANGFDVDVKGSQRDGRGSYCANRPAAEDATYFTSENLSRYRAIVFLDTTTSPDGTILDDTGKAALEAYIRAGGGFVGIHAATDAEYHWTFYHELLGARFLAHGPAVTSSLRIEDAAHPSASTLPNPWSRFDEWYDFTENPRSTAHVIINLDETTYPDNPAPMGDHPIAWCKSIGAGRSFYTGLGDDAAAFRDPLVRQHLLGGILYAAGAADADCSLSAAPAALP